MGLFFITLFFFIIFVIYQNYLETIKTYVLIYDNISKEQAYYLMIFNSLREYLFDCKSIIFKGKIDDYLNKALDDIYKFKLQKENVI